MVTKKLDYKGFKCPQPVLKLAIEASKIEKGTTVEIEADCPSFPDDVKKWCEKTGKVLITITNKGAVNTAVVQF